MPWIGRRFCQLPCYSNCVDTRKKKGGKKGCEHVHMGLCKDCLRITARVPEQLLISSGSHCVSFLPSILLCNGFLLQDNFMWMLFWDVLPGSAVYNNKRVGASEFVSPIKKLRQHVQTLFLGHCWAQGQDSWCQQQQEDHCSFCKEHAEMRSKWPPMCEAEIKVFDQDGKGCISKHSKLPLVLSACGPFNWDRPKTSLKHPVLNKG